jgi:hypothetical protein
MLRLFPWALSPALLSVVIGFKRVDGWPLHELIPLKLGWWMRRRRHQWFRPVPLLAAGESATEAMPPGMQQLELLDVDASWVVAPGRLAGIGVVRDLEAGQLTAVLRVTGDGQFSLASPEAQDTRLSMWGDALAAFCRERLTVCRIAWQEWSTSTRVEAAPSTDVDSEGTLVTAASDYIELVVSARQNP